MVAKRTARDELRIAIDIEIAGRSVLDAAIWRMPPYQVVEFHRQLAVLCDRVVDSAFEGTSLQVAPSAPPRHGKTELLAIATITRCAIRAWQEGRAFAVLYVTAKDTLARRITRTIRAVLTRLHEETGDDWFAPDPDGEWTAESLETRGGFVMRGIGRGGATGGIGANLILLDDLIGSNAAYRSPAERQAIVRALEEDFLSRGMDGAAAIHMETRRGTEDTTAWLQRERPDQWEFRVWRCYDAAAGAYLWARRMDDARRAKLGLTDTSPVWRSLYQQEPVPEGGTLIAPDWLDATYSESPAAASARADRVVLGVDLAATGRTTSDHCSYVVIGVRGAYRDVLHVERARLDYPAQRQRLLELVAEWSPSAIVVELAAGGHGIVAELQAVVPGLRGESPKGDKVTRLTPHLPAIQARQLRLPARPEPWVRAYREELTAFSGTPGEPDDQVDATAWALVASAESVAPSSSDWLALATGRR